MMSGGALVIFRAPSSTVVSLAAAWALSLLVALAAVLAASARSTGSWMPARIRSTPSCVYQIVSVSSSANRRMNMR